MPSRPLPFGSDTLEIPAYLAKGDGSDDPGFQRWKLDHPDWFAAGTWTPAPRPRQTKPPVPDGGGQDGTKRLSPTEVAELTTLGSDRLDPSTLSVSDFLRVAASAGAEAARGSLSSGTIEDSTSDPFPIPSSEIQTGEPRPSGGNPGGKGPGDGSFGQILPGSRSYAPVPRRSAARAGIATSAGDSDQRATPFTYRIDPPSISDGPYAVAAIDFDPRTVALTPSASAVEDEINRATLEVIAAAQGEFDKASRQSAASTLHARLARALRDRGIPGVFVEQTTAPNGDTGVYGQDGAVRTDVIYRNPATGDVEAIWDYKVGNAALSLRRAQELAEYAAGVANRPALAPRIPVREIKIRLVPVP